MIDSATMANHDSNRFGSYKIAVLVPCYNEQATVGKVVEDFRTALRRPESSYSTRIQRTEPLSRPRRGRRSVPRDRAGEGLRRAAHVLDVEADIYALVDGDTTYDASSARRMIGLSLEKRLDMVVASRYNGEWSAYRAGRRTGNRLLIRLRRRGVRLVFNSTSRRAI